MPSAELPAWKAQLGEPNPVRDHTQLGLLFQLRTLTHAGSQWTAPKAEQATSVRPRGTQRLAVRPVTLSATGNWVTGDVSWNDLPYRVERLGLDPRQVAWFLQLHALSRGTGEGYRASEAGWIYLDDIASPLLWPLLRGAGDVGVVLVSGKRATDVHLGEHAVVTVEIGHDSRSPTALRLDPRLTIDDEAAPATGLTADHGVYSCRFDRGLHLALAPASTNAIEALRWDRAALRIPTSDVAEFWRDYYPDLAQRMRLHGDGIVLPDVTTETVLLVEFLPRDVVTTRWELHTGRRRVALKDPPFAVAPRLTGADAAAFITNDLPTIAATGVRVETVGTQPSYREETGTPALRFVKVEVDGHNDWLDLGFAIVIGEYTMAFSKVFEALSRGRKRLLMVDKTWMSLNHPVFDLLRELIEDGAALREWEGGALVPPHLAPRFEPFEDSADESPGALAWRATAAALTSAPPEIPAPAGLRADLRPYQLDGFRWLAHLHAHGLGGILADDMGLGKTLQAIALFAHTRGSGRVLVVAPTSVIGTWESEIARFAPDLRVAVLRTTRDDIPSDVDVVVVSYAVFRLEFERFSESTWDTLVLDEAQYVKNPTSQVHECAEALPARVKIALSGTPMENGLLDLWAILRIVAPGMFASRLKFTDRYIKAHSPERIAELRRRIRPILMRRTKASVALELPPKQEQVVTIELEPEHRALYDRYLQRERQKLLDLVEDLDRNRFIVFRSLTLLRLLALDPRLIGEEQEVPSSKLDELLDRIDDLAAEGHRALVFSQFTGYLALVRERLEARGIAYEYLDGATTRRDEVITRFREGDAPLFLVSLRAGGVGLTLTEADYVFLLDPWWNPAAEAQAIDRTHRIGQDKPVMVYRLVARDTIEEKVLALGEGKRKLFNEVIDDGDMFATGITADDVRSLLG